MKRKTISIIATCMMAFLMMSSFRAIPSASASNLQTLTSGTPITIISSNTTTIDDITYRGDVELAGAINARGTYEMPTQIMGNALHCTFILTLPSGTITIRLLCNMMTLNGRWRVLSGTGAYENLSGWGSLTMPGIEEALTGIVSGL